MKKYIHVFFAFTITIMLISCASGKPGNSNVNLKDSETKKIEGPDCGNGNIHYDYNSLLKAQKKILKDFSWPGRHELDLNDDGTMEIFLAVEGYSRGMNYALFSKKNRSWILISDDEGIPSGHLGIKKSESKNNGWHDFIAYQPSGRDGVIESHYTWNGKQYILKKQKEVRN